ncbi:hypothetical protein VitviT2T_025345 [Vitis vinifera]|uniref:Protein kinase domain-containing protein n=1 Tax=Vitis vinifera TaxID=29760 RepID=A0ABY9DLE6_VITVI|nr:hypothetical protein VitviT2T_025345 [Vitis vinifera]|eukprot:XP_010662820.1 PREDICTED: rust resistance kinase Lr10-like [Vitis vinifera]
MVLTEAILGFLHFTFGIFIIFIVYRSNKLKREHRINIQKFLEDETHFGNVSSKSDVYSFGMLLIEMVGGRKNIDATVENTSQAYFPEWLYNHLDQEQEVHIRIEDESDIKIAKKLSIIGLWCIQWYPIDRPSMKIVVGMLEGEEGNLVMPPNPFTSMGQTRTSVRRRKTSIQLELTVISEIE